MHKICIYANMHMHVCIWLWHKIPASHKHWWTPSCWWKNQIRDVGMDNLVKILTPYTVTVKKENSTAGWASLIQNSEIQTLPSYGKWSSQRTTKCQVIQTSESWCKAATPPRFQGYSGLLKQSREGLRCILSARNDLLKTWWSGAWIICLLFW